MDIVKPTPQQVAWADIEFGFFCHFSIYTFNNLEWSDGTKSPRIFNPTRLDCDQWVRVVNDAGARYMVLTCKHHDGFCLWQTDTTDYSVKASPYKNGKGDVVAEFVAACRKHGMKFGFYLSPWDRHELRYKDKVSYDQFYAAQLTELVTRYAQHDEIFELWFDGAGSSGREYDWNLFLGVIIKNQSNAMRFNLCSPTIRWVGNEGGYAPYLIGTSLPTITSRSGCRPSAMCPSASGTGFITPECGVSFIAFPSYPQSCTRNSPPVWDPPCRNYGHGKGNRVESPRNDASQRDHHAGRYP